MPMIDMPLEQMKVYRGCSPKPADFDAYWDESLAEMHALDADVQITPANFQTPVADCYDLYYTGAHGARIYAKLLKPKHIQGKCPAVLTFHGYSGRGDDWGALLGYAATGFVVASLDCRGQAGKSEDVGGYGGGTFHGQFVRGISNPDPKRMLYRDIFLDTAQLAGILMDMEEVDEARVAAVGNSNGGALTLACAALEPRIKLAGPVHPFLCDFKRVWDMDMDVRAYEELKDYFRNFDPRHEQEEEIFCKLGYIDIQNLAPRIKASVKWFTGLMDDVCPPSTQFAAYNKLTCPKDMVIYPDFGHEGLPDAWEIRYQWLVKNL